MATFKCTTCGGTYVDFQADGTRYLHACPPEKINHAVTDQAGKVVTPETREPLRNRRDENVEPGLQFTGTGSVPNRCIREVPIPEERGRTVFVDAQPGIISEGAGREVVG